MKHQHRFSLSCVALAALALSTGSALAQSGPTMTVSGFGSAALTMTDSDEAEFTRPNQGKGVRKSARSLTDSNLGVQATAKFNDTFSLTAQGLARQGAGEHFGAELSLAFAKLRLNDDFSLRVGRMGLPVYMVSDFLNVGYANTMLRPSNEVYSQVVNNVFDGADLLYQHSFGDTVLTAQLGFGSSSAPLPFGAKSKLKKSTTLNVIAEHGPFTLRLGHNRTRVSLVGITPLDDLLGALREVGMSKVADDLSLANEPGTFTSVGMTMDYKNFVVQSEFARRRTSSRLLIESTTAYYAMVGYRIGKVTPYYYYGNTTQDSSRTYPGLLLSGPLAGLSFAVGEVIKAPLQSSHAIGVRWDVHKSASFKAQLDRISPRDGAGLFINPAPQFKGPVHVLAAGIDFVF